MMNIEVSIKGEISISVPSLSPSFLLPTATENNFSPATSCFDCPLQTENNKLRSESGYWQGMHRKAKEREEELRQENKDLKAKLKHRERQLFGRNSEKSKGKSEQQDGDEKEKRKRGQQPGTPGHGRKRHEDLPVLEEEHDLPEKEKCCPCCSLPYVPFPGTEDSEVVEVEVQAHVRRIRRKRYKRICSCRNLPVIITAKGPAKLIPKGGYGDSVWTEILLDKFLFYRPTSRLLESFNLLGLNMSQGTVTDGLKRLLPLFEPVLEQIIIKNQTENHWHADETRWLVFEEVQGKSNYRWYLWVFKSASTVVYILDPSRSSQVPRNHLKDVNQVSILSVDRYSAYKVLIKEMDGCILLAYCWAHVRRDFLNLAKNRPEHEDWAMEWVEQIGMLYHLNNYRLEVSDDPAKFVQADEALRSAAYHMDQQCSDQLSDKTLLPDREKILKSLSEHWKGLMLFIDHPEVPMDNNAAERALRGPVVGRKNFYGSGAKWSGMLAATLFTIFQTLLLWGINHRVWLEKFFLACAANGGYPPEDVSPFLPWNMNEQELEIFRKPPKTP